MPLDMTAALNQFGFVGTLANAIPELKKIFEQAAREECPPAQFDRAVQDSAWFKTHADTTRALITLQQTDPATYASTVKNARIRTQMLASEMGLAPLSDARANQIAITFLSSGYDSEDVMRRWLALNVGVRTGEAGSLFGDAAQLQEQMKVVAQSYGVSYTDRFLSQQIQQIQAGNNTLDGFESLMRARAKAAFPQFAAQLDAGLTVRDIADPYIGTMANTLEMAETEINLNNPWIKKALSQKDAAGAQSSMPLWQFERQLKDDPRYDKTKQARTEAFETVRQVGRDFGFAT